MKDIPRVGFVCTGENALELSGAICCAGRFMRLFTENGYMTGGCYSCISPSSQAKILRERIGHMCTCNDVVVTVGCDGFRSGDVLPEIVTALSTRELSYFSAKLSADEYIDAETGLSHKCFPSRSTAVMCSSAVILTVSSDLKPSLGKLNSLLGALGYAVGNSTNKAPAKSLELEDLIADYYVERSFQD